MPHACDRTAQPVAHHGATLEGPSLHDINLSDAICSGIRYPRQSQMPKILFIHENFPAQFGGIAHSLMKQGWDVLFATASKEIPDDKAVHRRGNGLRVVRYSRSRDTTNGIHRYLQNSEDAVLNGQGFLRLAAALLKGGYSPDVIVAHSGWGSGSLAKVAWPDAKLVQYLEWWYNFPGPDGEPHSSVANQEDAMAKTLCRNLPFLLDLQSTDSIVVPTHFQARQAPDFLQPLVTVQHDGIDCDFFHPTSSPPSPFPFDGIPENAPILTYATRGMEPMRGFMQFMAAASRLQRQFPELHILIAGTDRVCYGAKLPNGRGFKQEALNRFTFDPARLHFVGHLPKPRYRSLLQSSTVHVYLTRPFVASWSLVEAMACGCAIVSCRNDAIEEIAVDGRDALLVDMDDVSELTRKVGRALTDERLRRDLGASARARALDKYSTAKCHPVLADLFSSMVPPVAVAS